MPVSLSAKLRIKPGMQLLSLHAPADFQKRLTDLPAGVQISEAAKTYDQVHWFVTNRAQLEKEMTRVMKLVKPGVLVWVYYPKGTSKLQTDLTRDKGWDCLLAEGDKLTWISLISFDDTWSVFGFRAKNDADRNKERKPKVEREVLKWVNPKTREVKLPNDLGTALKKNNTAAVFFDSLSFTNKKEYVEWVVTAKKEETRQQRIAGTIEKLSKKWKNLREM